MTARDRRRGAIRVANRRADWQTTIALPFGSSGVTVALPLPMLRRLRHDPALLDRIGRGVVEYVQMNRLDDPSSTGLSPAVD